MGRQDVRHFPLSLLLTTSILTAVAPSSLHPLHHAAMAPRKAPSLLKEIAFVTLLSDKHLHQALNDIIQHDISKIDPVIGDASCQMRIGFLLDTQREVIDFLKDNDALDEARDLVRKYKEAHAKDRTDSQVRTEEDAKGAEHDGDYDKMIESLRTLLGPNRISYVTLCKTFSLSAVITTDEFGCQFSSLQRSFLAISNKTAEQTGSQKDLYNLQVRLRRELALLAIKYFTDQTATLPRVNPQLVPGDTPVRRRYVEDQLIEADHLMRSVIPSDITADFDIPLMMFYNLTRLIGIQEFTANRPILLWVPRIKLTPLEQSGPAEPIYTYAYVGSILLMFKPNQETGRFELSTSQTPGDEEQFCLFVSAWSTFVAGTEGRGLDAESTGEYREALGKCDPWWLVLQCAAVHDPYTRTARDNNRDYSELYHAVCEKQTRSFAATRKECQGLNYKKHVDGDVRPNLVTEWTIGRQVGASRGNCGELRMSEDGAYTRINRAVDFQVDHLRCNSLKCLKAEIQTLEARHSAAPNAVIGSYVLRMGSRGFSCTDKKVHDEIKKTNNNNKKKKIYLTAYPDNAALLRRSETMHRFRQPPYSALCRSHCNRPVITDNIF